MQVGEQAACAAVRPVHQERHAGRGAPAQAGAQPRQRRLRLQGAAATCRGLQMHMLGAEPAEG